MNREDIIRMAREADIKFKTDVFCSDFCDGVYEDDFERFAALVASAEREACAKVADGWPDYDVEGLAEAIRARGTSMTKDEALERKAENARELGLDYEPQRTWVGLTKEERHEISMANRPYCADIMAAHEEELKRRNT